jgi:hypothetical protein
MLERRWVGEAGCDPFSGEVRGAEAIMLIRVESEEI